MDFIISLRPPLLSVNQTRGRATAKSTKSVLQLDHMLP